MSTKREQIKTMHNKRKEETERKIFETIERMKKENMKINFTTVSEQSGISKKTLYNKEEVVNLINKIRGTNTKKKDVSDSSKDRIIEALKRKNKEQEERIKELESILSKKMIEEYEKI